MSHEHAGDDPHEMNQRLVRAQVTINRQEGVVFRSVDLKSYCFVPSDCVAVDAEGRVSVDELRYVLSGWSVRNLRASSGESGGSHLFPQPAQVVSDFSAPGFREFLHRIAGPGA